jgi:hypothetical protein
LVESIGLFGNKSNAQKFASKEFQTVTTKQNVPAKTANKKPTNNNNNNNNNNNGKNEPKKRKVTPEQSKNKQVNTILY